MIVSKKAYYSLFFVVSTLVRLVWFSWILPVRLTKIEDFFGMRLASNRFTISSA